MANRATVCPVCRGNFTFSRATSRYFAVNIGKGNARLPARFMQIISLGNKKAISVSIINPGRGHKTAPQAGMYHFLAGSGFFVYVCQAVAAKNSGIKNSAMVIVGGFQSKICAQPDPTLAG